MSPGGRAALVVEAAELLGGESVAVCGGGRFGGHLVCPPSESEEQICGMNRGRPGVRGGPGGVAYATSSRWLRCSISRSTRVKVRTVFHSSFLFW